MRAFLFFHCNLAFSSIEERDRQKVIGNCYYPILKLAEGGLPVGLEATAWTLLEIKQLCPQWFAKFLELLAAGKIEFIGSGFAQIIGPLAPWPVNLQNQLLGQDVYEELLGFRPQIALINEQAYSAGILDAYKKAGYAALIMEWDNCASQHPEWPASLRYAPQKFANGLGLIWNQSEIFQQLQRVSHDELDVDDYLNYLGKHIQPEDGALCLYGNDAEIFNYRPGRFETEAQLSGDEWQRLRDAIMGAVEKYSFQLSLPSEILHHKFHCGGKTLKPESSAQPVIVKKQPKYNLLRWAVSGRNDARINARCVRLSRYLEKNDPDFQEKAKWLTLCELWASDYRTHITADRWQKYLDLLERTEKKWNPPVVTWSDNSSYSAVDKELRYLRPDTGFVKGSINLQKGLAIDKAEFPAIADKPLFGTLPHGYFEDIALAADFFSGHIVMEAPGEKKFTDLAKVSPEIRETKDYFSARANIPDFYCPLVKELRFSRHAAAINLHYRFKWRDLPRCSIRLLHLTLNPEAFDGESLFYAAANGGLVEEYFSIASPINHCAPVSLNVSANCATGMTSDKIHLGDRHKYLLVTVEQTSVFLVGMIYHRRAADRFLTRLILSFREFDDTARSSLSGEETTISISIQAMKNEKFFSEVNP